MSEPKAKFAPLYREPAYLKVYRAIEENIVEGGLADGEALPIEAALCEQFQVTRSTVREGLRLLEQSGLIVRGSHKKFIVRRPNASDVAAAASRSLALGGVTFSEVWETLAIYYPQAARLAATRLDEESLAELNTVWRALEANADDDHDKTVACAVEFFQSLAKGLDNRVMLAMLQSLNMMIGESLRQVIGKAPNARSRILNAQKNILDAFSARDEALAEEWMAKHIADLKRGYVVAKVEMDQPIL